MLQLQNDRDDLEIKLKQKEQSNDELKDKINKLKEKVAAIDDSSSSSSSSSSSEDEKGTNRYCIQCRKDVNATVQLVMRQNGMQ